MQSSNSNANPESKTLKRAMSTRHLVMLSLGGAIGTGLFLGSGEVIAQTGPVGAIIAYILGGLIAYMVMLCLGELAVHMPVAGSFGAYAQKYIGPGTGYMISWVYWLTWTATLGTEFTAAALLMQEWFPHISMWIWTIIFAVTILGLNLTSTRMFAESEFWLALVKVVTVIAFIILGLLAIFGLIPFHGSESAPLFHNLTAHGWFPQGLVPIFTTMLIVNFAFSGTELIGVAAGETKDPAVNVPKAINAAIWRLLIFFVGTIIVISALLPFQIAGLGGEGVSSSPFVTVFNYIGIPYADDIIRFVIITALLSAANSGLYAASRMMWSLSDQRQLPSVFSKLSKSGTPIIALVVTMFGAIPGLLSEHFAPETIFKNLLGVAAFTMVIVWMSICWSQFNFRRQWYKAGHSAKDLKFAAPLYPIVPILGFIFCFITGLSMAADPEMQAGFIGCLLFIAACYLSHYVFYRDRT
ncbi:MULTISPECIES: amino acid permease [Acinetobacter]|jgi:S-methylmethionine transporter|uniref:Amino-acid permease RocC n=1 Tax=Acinetobacter venetianus TaxID=52133 RepID=A0A137Y2K4_9GAMM|nr:MULTISPECIES: amino acid permease [Acinetobacter]MDA0696605.1 amino acid permease [Pseudomonadota bacterium]ERQ00181.1 S-methylmethionine transporter [Acinetobacter sp. COS3]KXO80192.1 amino acid transporter [Acinetobacter venetianus]KXO84241.1 amino acid transporter [Acinetobacter venetianus]KXZ62024.1 Amino-acid permease RocC [Acinetobacter venetianus]